MRITYDNSADNVRNPSHPPRRVRAGNRSIGRDGASLAAGPAAAARRPLAAAGGRHAAAAREIPRRLRGPREPGRGAGGTRPAAEAVEQYRRGPARAARTARRCSTTWARSCSRRDDPDEALRRYREAVRAQPDYASARYNLGNALAAQGRVRRGAAALPRGRAAAAGRPPARNNLGAALLATGRADEAIAVLRRSWRPTRLAERRASTWAGRWPRAGDLAEAAEQFEQARAHRPAATRSCGRASRKRARACAGRPEG